MMALSSSAGPGPDIGRTCGGVSHQVDDWSVLNH